MKKAFALCALAFSICLSWSAAADVAVRGYYRSNGTYVHPHYRSDPNGTVQDNWSYKGNVNPHTGESGHNYYPHDATSPYFVGPDSQGRIGHANALPYLIYTSPSSAGAVPYYAHPGETNLCPPPRYHMTGDGCQPVH